MAPVYSPGISVEYTMNSGLDNISPLKLY
ncbi:hypothetical protein AGR1A_Lc40343 [Agrobacterium fabacearum CFBP 5771]|nr:hypothetical protein AGR1A_Lc40343 [Agrobacterium fabacearum CFBP 5771]